MLTRFLTLLILSIPLFCQAQSYTIKKGDESKTFSADTYYVMEYSSSNEKNCCKSYIYGYAQRVFKDSIQINMNSMSVNNEGLDYMFKMYTDIKEEDFLISVPRSDLKQVTAYKSRESVNKKKSWNNFGTVLLVTGITTLANSYDLKEKSFRNGVLISAGAQISVGILVASLSSKKQYKIEKGWQF